MLSSFVDQGSWKFDYEPQLLMFDSDLANVNDNYDDEPDEGHPEEEAEEAGDEDDDDDDGGGDDDPHPHLHRSCC